MLELRPYQSELVAQARATLRQGVKRLLVTSPTGSGKTCLVAHMLASAAAKGKRAWFVVHRKELLAQAVETFVTAADLHVGIIAARYPSDSSAPVQVCAVGSLKKRLAKVAKPDLIVWDECHHLPSKSWSDLAAALPCVHIGLTATPARLDGRGLRPYFDALLCGPSTADLIAAGYLSPYRLYAPAQFDFGQLHKVAGDYNRKEVNAALVKSTVVGDAVGTYQRHAEQGRALVFAWSLDASRAISAAFNARGIRAEHVDGDTPSANRAATMHFFRRGDIRVITSMELFSEGLDVPAVDAVFLLRPTASLGLYLQQCGRGLRPSPGKESVRIFDHVGNYSRHGLPDDPRAWTLDGIEKTASERLSPLKRCTTCYRVAGAAAKACPYCHAPYPVKARSVVQIAGELAETELSALRAQVADLGRQCHSLSDWHALAKRLGYGPIWAGLRHEYAVRRQSWRGDSVTK